MNEQTVPAPRPPSLSLGWRIAIAAAAVAAALVAVYPAAIVDWLACESGPSAACDRQDLAPFQVWVAVAGIAPTLALAYALVRGRMRFAIAMVVVAVATYLAWALFADAAVRGWDGLKFFPS